MGSTLASPMAANAQFYNLTKTRINIYNARLSVTLRAAGGTKESLKSKKERYKLMKRYVHGIVVFSIVALLTACGGEESSTPSADTPGLAPAAPAADTGTSESTPAPTVAGEYVLEGKVSQINTISNTFVLKTDDGDIPIQVRVMSRIMLNGERKPLAAIKSGSYAKGTYKKWSGKDTVKEIVITPN